MRSVTVDRRVGVPACLGSSWPLDIILSDAVVVCLISVLLLELSCTYCAREMVWNCHLFSLLLYIIQWTEGGEKISVGSLIWRWALLWDSYSLVWNKIHVAPHLCTCRRALQLLKLDPTLELHGWPLRGKFPKCRQAASQIYHSPLKQKVKLSRFKATTCRPYNQLFLLFWIILCFSYSLPVFFFCLLCLFVLFLFPLSLVLSVIYPSCLTDISGFGVVLNRGESSEQ